MTPDQPAERRLGVPRLARLWHRLTEPHPAVAEPVQRSRAHLLSALLIGLVVVAGGYEIWYVAGLQPVAQAWSDPKAMLTFAGLVLLLLTYWLSRTCRSAVAAVLFVTGASLLMFAVDVVSPKSPLDSAWLLLGVLLCSLLLSPRATALLLAVTCAGALILPRLVEAPSWLGSADAEIFLVVNGLLIVAVAVVRRQDLKRLEEQGRTLAEGEAALRASEAQYRDLVTEVNDGVYACDVQGVVTFANPALAALVGREHPDQLLGRRFFEFIAPAVAGEVAEHFGRAMESGDPGGPITVEIVRDDGTSVKVEVKSAVVTEGDRVVGLKGVLRDVSERERAAAALREREAQYRRLVENVHDVIYAGRVGEDHLAGPLTFVSPQVEAVFGLAPQEFLEDAGAWFASIHPEDGARLGRETAQAFAAGRPLRRTYRVRDRRTGAYRWLEDDFLPEMEDGRAVGYFGVARDVTERRQAEQALRESEARLTAAQAVAKVGSWETGLTDLTVVWSAETYRIFELEPSSFGSSHPSFLTYVHPEDREKVEAAFAASFDSRSPKAIEHRIITPGGLVKSIEERWQIVRDDQGRPVRAVGTCQDITERKQAEEAIHRQAQQLQRAVEGTVQAMSQVVEMRDPYTTGHERRVAELAAALGAELGLGGEELAALRYAGLIHDVGKVGVPAEILSKPGRLSEVEFSLIRQHPQAGFEILAPIDFGRPVAEIVLQHHERLDGSGYPQGLAAEAILPEARILTVADVVEAMSSHRPYRPALGMAAALAEVREHAGVKYDAEVVAACVRLVEERGFAFTP